MIHPNNMVTTVDKSNVVNHIEAKHGNKWSGQNEGWKNILNMRKQLFQLKYSIGSFKEQPRTHRHFT